MVVWSNGTSRSRRRIAAGGRWPRPALCGCRGRRVEGGSVGAVVSRGGRPDLVEPEVLARVAAPTLLIVGGLDTAVLALNRQVAEVLRCEHDLVVIPGATHLFEEPGALEQVAVLAR